MDVREKARAARAAALQLSGTTDAARRAALDEFARLLEARSADVEAANGQDLKAAEAAVASGMMSPALYERLSMKGSKLRAAVESVRAVSALPDPLGRTLRSTLLDDGLKLYQVTVPIGVVACAFESRPDAAVQMSALAIRSGNAILLKGGREAAHTNAIVAELAREALRATGLPPDAVNLIADREELMALLALDDLVDLLIPRGSSEFVRFVQSNTRIPVMGHAEGVCHTYVDAAADLEKALRVAVDAKVDYPAACNATECFLVHRAIAPTFVPRVVEALRARRVEVRASDEARRFAPQAAPASPEDFGREYGDLQCALALVEDVEDAIRFVNRHGSRHTEAILTEDAAAARRFIAGVDAAGVFVNASTRFADGYRYGLGAEVGISTGKLHARGPVGLDGLTSTKWILEGDGHVASTYRGDAPRAFKHEPLREAFHGA